MPDVKISAMTPVTDPPPASQYGSWVPVVYEGAGENYRVKASLLLKMSAQVEDSGFAGTSVEVIAGAADANGTSLAGGSLTLGAGDSLGTTGTGGDINLVPGQGTAADGVVKVNGNAALVPYSFAWGGGFNLNGMVLLVATRAMRIAAISGRVGTPEGAVATLTVVKAASGVAITSGTALTSDSFNANGAANTNQALTLNALPTILLDAGDAIGITTTGTWVAGSGVITVWMTYGPA